jgi:hypothetical protein
MNGNLTLGRLGGVQVTINWSLLVVFALIVWSLAATVFPSQNPGLSDGVHLAMAIVAALLFFASVLLHELGHACQARREGMEIEGITLWLFGGIAQFKGVVPERRRRVANRDRRPARHARTRRGLRVACARGPAQRRRRGRCLAGLHQPVLAHLQPDSGVAVGRRPRAARSALAGER